MTPQLERVVSTLTRFSLYLRYQLCTAAAHDIHRHMQQRPPPKCSPGMVMNQ